MRPVILIIVLAALIRFIFLDKVPNAIGGDELHYAITAKSVFLTGQDISGTWSPWSLLLFRYPPHEQQAELPYLMHLLSSAPFGFSLFLFKLPFVLLGVGTVVLLYLVATILFGTKAGIATGLIAAINPWLVVMDRTGYESTPSTFFYLLALYILLRVHSWKLLWAIIPLILAFYSYIATKVTFIPFVITSSFLAFFVHKKRLVTHYIILCGISIAIIAYFFIMFKTNSDVSRLNDIFLPNSPFIAQQVDEIRRTAIQSTFLPLIANKYTVYTQIISSKLLRIFSPEYLFIQGDQFFLPGKQSFFYYIDAFFLFVGFLFLFVKKRLYAFIIGVYLLVGTLPHLLSTTMGDFSIHLSLMFPFLVILIGAGIAETLQSIPKKFYWSALFGVVLLYVANIAGFFLVYFSQYPLTGTSNFPMRVLTKYLQLARAQDKTVVVHAALPSDLFQKYIYYSDSITKQNIPLLSPRIFAQEIEFNSIQFVQCDAKKTYDEGHVVIFDRECDKKVEEPYTAITSLVDGGETYKILDDSICSNYELTRYPEHVSMNDFAIETLSEKHFCQKYISIR